MSPAPLTISVTGAAGQIGYALLFRLASGAVFGPDQPVRLRLIEIEPRMKALQGVVMELEDGAFPLVQEIVATSELAEGFADANWAWLIGSVPRQAGMERGDLLVINGGIFTGQGRAIDENAADDCRVLVVGNPCNTNCLIAQKQAKRLPADRWFAMTRLDENRAKSQLAAKAGRPVSAVSHLAIWGNHSATQYPDFYHARIAGVSAAEVIGDETWLQETFLPTVQKRGAAIIEARGASSAASAASAIIDTVRSLTLGTPEGDWTSVAVVSDGSYGIEPGLVVGLPIAVPADGVWQVVEGIELNAFSQEKIRASVAELESEREAVQDLLGWT
ncbi:MAG: malate dehydrogenase [Verrucomicrobiota bacterium]